MSGGRVLKKNVSTESMRRGESEWSGRMMFAMLAMPLSRRTSSDASFGA